MWIFFDEPEKEAPAPRFCLPLLGSQAEGELHCLEEFAGDCNLVLAFFPHLSAAPFRSALETLSTQVEAYRRAEGQVLAVVGTANEQDAWAAKLALPVLHDAAGEVRAAYTSLMAAHLTTPEDALLFVLDRYLVPYTAFIDTELDPAALLSGIISWLDFMGMQCPE